MADNNEITYLGKEGTKVLATKIKNKVLQYDTKTAFETDLTANKIASNSAVFIKDTDQLYFNGRYYGAIPKNGKEKQILQWKASGEAKWTDIGSAFTGLEDVLAYGVRIDQSVKDPHLTRIGNASLHKTLPIQSQLKGCIAQGEQIQYWLDENDWRFRKNPIVITANFKVLNVAGGDVKYTLTADTFSTLQYEAQYVKINGAIAQVVSIDTTNKVATIIFEDSKVPIISEDGKVDTIKSSDSSKVATIDSPETPISPSYSVEVVLGSVRNGYDGNVCVYVPNFYIKSKKVSDRVYDIYITSFKIDDSYQYQHEGLLGAYKATVLNTVPENMGYLSTLKVNSAVSIVNTHNYCRGGDNRSDYDTYLNTDRFRTDLGKPKTNIPRADMRTYCKNSGGRMLDYNSYKNIMYWLYVIEYANFNCQEAFNAELTPEGYKQGGLGDGITTWTPSWNQYNNMCPLTPCGYGDILGNGTGVIDLVIPETKLSNSSTLASKTFSMPRWRGFDNPFGDIWTNLDGCLCDIPIGSSDASELATFYIIDDPDKYTDSVDEAKINVSRSYKVPRNNGYQGKQQYGNVADMVPGDVTGNVTQNICDYYYIDYNDGPTTLIVGGGAYDDSYNGLARFHVLHLVSNSQTNVGFRLFFGFASLSELKS